MTNPDRKPQPVIFGVDAQGNLTMRTYNEEIALKGVNPVPWWALQTIEKLSPQPLDTQTDEPATADSETK